MDDLKPTHIEVTFKPVLGRDVNGYPVILGLEECSHCFCVIAREKREGHLAWHRKVEQYPPSTEVFYYDTRQRFVDANPVPPPPPPRSPGEDFVESDLMKELFGGPDQETKS